jgi:ADP-ribose pyrophosphatase
MDVEKIAQETCHRGFLKLYRSTVSHALYGGGMSSPIVREHAHSGPVVAVLPYDPLRDRVILIRQFRVGAWAAGSDPAPWDIVAGIRDGEESAETAAGRELLEETGCAALGFETIGEFLTAPHISSERLTLLCARVHAFDGERQCGLPEEGEDILAASLSIDEAMAILAAGDFPLWAAMALQWLQANRIQLKTLWGGDVARGAGE